MINICSTMSTSILPVGSITAFVGEINTGPENKEFATSIEEMGWMLCDGRKLETHKYPTLFAVLGTLYGGELATDNSPSYFNIPDLGGMFLRGVGGNIASTESRKKTINGKDDGVGSIQEFAMQKHVHVYTSPVQGTVSPGMLAAVPVNNTTNPEDTTKAPTESIVQGKVKVSEYETRPTNMFVHYLIKFRY